MSLLKPLEKPLTFFHSGGSIIWRGDGRCVPITDLAEGLREWWCDQADAAFTAREWEAERAAHDFWRQLNDALRARKQWLRVVEKAA